nr:hypothetical protein [Tanacetum cinerariifolium]
MHNVAEISTQPLQSLIPPSREVNADDSTDKSLSRTSMPPVTQSKAPTLLDEVDKQNSTVQHTQERPFDTELEILFVKSFYVSQITKDVETANLKTTEDDIDYDELDKNPLSKKFKIMTPIPNFPTSTPLFSPAPLKEPSPPKDLAKGKGVDIEELVNLTKIKRLADLRAHEEESEKALNKLLNSATVKPQVLKWKENEEKKAKLVNEYYECIQGRTDPLSITKISFTINSRKEPTMRITKVNDPLNLTVYLNFKLRMLGFSKWLEVHALASKKSNKSNDSLLQSLKSKFQWVLNQAKNLGVSPPPALATFGMTAEDKKRKRNETLKEVFVKERFDLDGTQRNIM